MPLRKFSRFHLALLLLTTSVVVNFLQARYIGTLLDKNEQSAAKGKLAVGAKLPALEVWDLAVVRTTPAEYCAEECGGYAYASSTE